MTEQGEDPRVVVDIWGGENSQDHVARKIRTLREAMTLAERELLAGFLVNLRMEDDLSWGPDLDFDNRSSQ